jgi:hypothetical protein
MAVCQVTDRMSDDSKCLARDFAGMIFARDTKLTGETDQNRFGRLFACRNVKNDGTGLSAFNGFRLVPYY